MLEKHTLAQGYEQVVRKLYNRCFRNNGYMGMHYGHAEGMQWHGCSGRHAVTGGKTIGCIKHVTCNKIEAILGVTRRRTHLES